MTDAYGNVSTAATQTITVEETPPTLSINAVEGDNIITFAEASASSGVALSGAVTGLASGASFNVSVVDGAFSKTYSATVGPNGAWTATIPSVDAVTLPSGAATVSAQATDAYGNVSAVVTQTVSVEEAATITISPVDGDNLINFAEARSASGVAITGSVTGLAAGATFNVTVVDGAFSKTYLATVGANGVWTATLPSSDAAALADGTAVVAAKLSGGATAGENVTVAETRPSFTAVADNPAKADLDAGQTVTITLTASEAVTVSGAPTILLNDGGVATYDAAHSTATTLAFDYTVQSGQNTAKLLADVVNLNGGSIVDGYGNAIQLSLGSLAQTGPKIDTQAPVFIGISETPTTGDLGIGRTVRLYLTTDEAVTVSGAPTLTLNDNDVATFDAAASNSTHLAFTYKVAAGQSVASLAATALNLAGGDILDLAGNPANLSLANITQVGPQIDGVAPTITAIQNAPASGDLDAGKTVSLTFTMSKNVIVTGAPLLRLNDGGVARYDAAKSSATQLVFDYTVAAGQNTSSLQVASLGLNGGAIRDAAGNSASLSLTGLTQTGPRIDTKAPTFTAIAETPASGDLDAGKSVKIALTTSEAVTVTGGPTLALDDGGTATYDAANSTATSLVFDYTVSAGQNVAALKATSVNLAGGTIEDLAGNAAVLSLAGLAQTGPKIDTTPPKFTAVAETPSTGDLDAGKTVTIALTASEAVVVTGAPTLTLNDGGVATYDAAKSTATALVFDYTAAAGQNTAALQASAIDLAGGTIDDLAGNAADLSLAGLVQRGPKIDTAPPSITTITETPATGAFDAGKTIVIALTTSEAVAVSGAPTLSLDDGATATYDAAASTATKLVFDYTIASGQNIAALDVSSVNLAGGSIDDLAGNAANLSLAGLAQAGPTVDTTPPTILSFSGAPSIGDLKTGQTETIEVTFSEDVAAKGGPALLLDDGGLATYASGSGSNVLTFDYHVLAGQTSTDLTVVGTDLPTTQAIADLAGNPLAPPATTASLGVAVNNYVTLTGGESFDLLGPTSKDVIFASGATGTLTLSDSREYSGYISGFTSSTTLDLRDIAFGTQSTIGFSGTTSGGVLSVDDGAHLASIALLGDYSTSNFIESSDGYGGTKVTETLVGANSASLTSHAA